MSAITPGTSPGPLDLRIASMTSTASDTIIINCLVIKISQRSPYLITIGNAQKPFSTAVSCSSFATSSNIEHILHYSCSIFSFIQKKTYKHFLHLIFIYAFAYVVGNTCYTVEVPIWTLCQNKRCHLFTSLSYSCDLKDTTNTFIILIWQLVESLES